MDLYSITVYDIQKNNLAEPPIVASRDVLANDLLSAQAIAENVFRFTQHAIVSITGPFMPDHFQGLLHHSNN